MSLEGELQIKKVLERIACALEEIRDESRTRTKMLKEEIGYLPDESEVKKDAEKR